MGLSSKKEPVEPYRPAPSDAKTTEQWQKSEAARGRRGWFRCGRCGRSPHRGSCRW